MYYCLPRQTYCATRARGVNVLVILDFPRVFPAYFFVAQTMAESSVGKKPKDWKCSNSACGKVLPGPVNHCPDCHSKQIKRCINCLVELKSGDDALSHRCAAIETDYKASEVSIPEPASTKTRVGTIIVETANTDKSVRETTGSETASSRTPTHQSGLVTKIIDVVYQPVFGVQVTTVGSGEGRMAHKNNGTGIGNGGGGDSNGFSGTGCNDGNGSGGLGGGGGGNETGSSDGNGSGGLGGTCGDGGGNETDSSDGNDSGGLGGIAGEVGSIGGGGGGGGGVDDYSPHTDGAVVESSPLASSSSEIDTALTRKRSWLCDEQQSYPNPKHVKEVSKEDNEPFVAEDSPSTDTEPEVFVYLYIPQLQTLFLHVIPVLCRHTLDFCVGMFVHVICIFLIRRRTLLNIRNQMNLSTFLSPKR